MKIEGFWTPNVNLFDLWVAQHFYSTYVLETMIRLEVWGPTSMHVQFFYNAFLLWISDLLQTLIILSKRHENVILL